MELASYGDLAVQLVNTGEAERPREDRLTDVAGLRAMIGDDDRWSTRLTETDVRSLRLLRARLREVFTEAAEGRTAVAVEHLNGLLADAVIRPQITDHDGEEFHLHVFEGATDVAQAFGSAAVMGLAVMLTEAGADRFGVCQATPCRNVFVDTSTNRSRRYCSDRCATRANVAAYRARRRAAG